LFKRNGIKQDELQLIHVKESFFHDINDEHQDSKVFDNTNIYDKLVISRNNPILAVWKYIYILCCLVSSYFYAFLAAFEHNFDKNDSSTSTTTLSFVFEGIFVINILLSFITEYMPESSQNPERDLSKIATRYLKTEFPLEFITVVPFQLLNLGGYQRLFYLVKIARLHIGFKVFNVHKIMQNIKEILRRRSVERIKSDPEFGEDTEKDNNNISTLIMIGSSLKIILLIIIILNISYFLGIIWFIFCDLSNQAYNHWGRTDEDIAENGDLYDTFYNQYELGKNTNLRNAIIVVYYAFTSLTTVGFGDFHPKSDAERITVSFILVFGVATFSYMMGIFIGILQKF
jgi:hypothetical protein